MRTEFDKRLRENDVNESIDMYGLKDQVYHYTSMAALYGILKKHELWFGNTVSMNDKSEGIYFIQQLQQALLEDLPTCNHSKCNSYFDDVYKKLKNKYPYAFCLSRLSDNAAQWERYADSASGVCIAFNVKNLLTLFHYCQGATSPAFYGYDIREHDHYKILKEYFLTEILREFDDPRGHGISMQISNMIACGYFHKHQSFATEQEVRISTLWGGYLSYSERAFELINGKIKSVLKFDLQTACKEEEVGFDFEDIIDQIIIGPRSEQNISELQNFIRSLGFQNLAEKVKKSDCPLR